MSDSTTVAYYEGGVPFNSKGEPIIIITGPIPDNGGGGGGAGNGSYGGASSQSGHSLAKWSTENLKKTQAELQKNIASFNQIVQNNINSVRSLSNKLIDITNKIIEANRAGPSVTDKAHQTNKELEAEAFRLSLYKAQKKAEEKKRKAEEDLKEAKRKKEAEQKLLEENQKRLEEAEAEEKRIAGLSPEEQKVIYTERDLLKSLSDIDDAVGDINTANQKFNDNTNKLNGLSSSLVNANNQLPPLQAEYATAVTVAKSTKIFAMDPLNIRKFLNARTRLVKASKDLGNKQDEIKSLNNQIDTLNTENNDLKNDIAKAKDEEAKAKQEYSQNVIKLEAAREELANSSLKSAFDQATKFSETMSEYLSQKFNALSKEFEKLTTSKKIKGVNDAVAKYDKFKDILNKKFSVKDREAISNALKSMEYAEWAKQFDVYARGFKYTGNLSTAYDIANDFIYGIDSGNWKPFFNSTQKFLAGKYVTGLLGGVLTALIVGSLPILAGTVQIIILELAIVAVLDALIEPGIDKVSDLLVDAVKSIP